MDRDSIIRSYVERITALEATRREALTRGDLHELARDLGMSDDDLAAADAARQAHLERGRGHARHQQWDDAIRELQEALAFEPMAVETLHSLSLAYRNRWRDRGYPADREEAAALARRVLEADPRHEPSYALLGELDSRTPAGDSTRRRSLRIFLVLILVIATGLGLLILDSRSGPDPAPIAGTIDGLEQSARITTGDGGISVELMGTTLSAGTTFNPINSIASSDGYDLLGVLGSVRPLELVALKCELLDADGRLVRSENISATAPRNGSTALEIRMESRGLARRVARVRLWVADIRWVAGGR